MSEERNDKNAPEGDNGDLGNNEEVAGADAASNKPRMRFQGIVETGSTEATAVSGSDFGIVSVTHDERRWNAMSRQVWLYSRLTAIFVFFSFIVGMPLGNYFAHLKIYGSATGWNLFAAYDLYLLLFSIIVPVLVLLAGYILSRTLTMLNAAESIAAVAQQIVTPDLTAARNVEVVGDVVQSHVSALNEGLDGALSRLASVEAMIRQHVEAIEIAGEAIEHKATNAVERVTHERSRLMELTESLNAHADSFAAAIAEKANTSIQSLEKADSISTRAESEFDDRLSRLEGAAARALTSFETLRDALRDSDGSLRASTEQISEATQETLLATEQSKAASNAAAESAAINAANVAASAQRASDTAREAADSAIQTATEEVERVANEAMEVAAREGAKVQQATVAALDDVTKNSQAAIDAAAINADKASKAAADISDAARVTSEAAQTAAENVANASEQARKDSQDALEQTKAAEAKTSQRNEELAKARAALEKENARLESLIDEQRNRADRLANAISSQTERLSRLAETQLQEQEAAAKRAEQDAQRAAALAEKEKKARAASKRTAPKATAPKPTAPKANGAARLEELARDIAERKPQKATKAASAQNAPEERAEPTLRLAANNEGASSKRSKSDVSWREILDATDDAEPLDLGSAAKKNGKGNDAPADSPRDDAENAIKIIAQLQHFTYDLETRLYGDPPPALQERFDRGDRNVFANRLLRLNEADVKRRIRTESGRDRDFEQNIHNFLQGFESLLEDATTSETADEELEEYLSSSLGRVYLLIGATVGYFA